MAAPQRSDRCRVLLVAPDDVDIEMETLRDVVGQANQWRPDADLEVWWWRTDSGPGMHFEGPQGLADERMHIADADLVVAVFWSRLGTAVAGDPSGTAHELRLAWQSWRDTGRPDVWVYFSTRDVPQSALADDQFAALTRFRRELPLEQTTWEFGSTDDLRVEFTGHLARWLRDHDGAPAAAVTVQTEVLFAPPSTSDSVVRADQVQSLTTALAKSGMVTLYGLSGSGKTRLAAQYGEAADRLPDHQTLLWYDVPESGTLEEMLASLSVEYSGQSDLGVGLRAKYLLNALRLRQSLLVLDDFHNGDRASFAPLVRAAAVQRNPGHLLLVSRGALGLPDAREIAVRPWTVAEVTRLVRELDLQAPLVNRLAAKTGGLPLAVKFFSVLVTSFARDPLRLLAGELAQTHLTESWFGEIKGGLSEHELALLRYFSLAQPDITEPVSRSAQKAIPEQERGRALSRLQALLLVESRAAGKWNVHPFVAEHTINDTPEEERRRLLSDLVRFTRAPLARRRTSEITPRVLSAAVRSCRYAQAAGDSAQASELIDAISGAAKRLGYYRPLRDLCQWHVMHNEVQYPWIYYHYAHCQLILGEVTAAISALETLPRHGGSPSLRLTVARTLADAWAEIGQPEKALSVLRTALEQPPGRTKADQTSHQYVQMALARVLVTMADLDEAESIATPVANDPNGGRTRAVALNVLGQVDQQRGRDTDVGRFRQAFAEFLAADDRRGMAWAQQHLADTLLTRYGAGSAEVRRCVRGAISIRLRSGESTSDYAAWLDRIRDHFRRDHGTLNMIDQERARLGTSQ